MQLQNNESPTSDGAPPEETRVYGAISVEDYLRLTEKTSAPKRRGSPWSRLMYGALLLSCLLGIAAGRYVPLFGRDTAKLTLTDALAVLERTPEGVWEHELGVVAVQRHIEIAIQRLSHVALESAQAGKDASLSLRQITRQGLRIIKELAKQGSHYEVHFASLRKLSEDMNQ